MTNINLFFNIYCNYIRRFSTISNKITSKCLYDLTLDAKNNKFAAIIGRDLEIRRCIDILCRKTKNNVILLGDPGVGKTAIVEALSHRISKGNVPEYLLEYKILSLDINCLFSKSDENIDTKLKNIITESKNNKVILFIDEAHLMLSKNYDWISVLKPDLSNGNIKCIASTTTSEYRKYFIKDKALQRRFQPIYVEEPDQSNTIEILKNLKPSFEYYHSVLISDESITSSVALSNKYIKDRFDPDKSIDLLDEACSNVKNRSQLTPESIEILNNMIQFCNENEIENIKLEIQKIESEYFNGRLKYNELKLLIKSYYESKMQESEALKSGKLEDVGKLRFDKIPNLEAQISKFMDSNSKYRNYLIVQPKDIADVLSKWLRIPINLINTSQDDLLNLIKLNLINSYPIYSNQIEVLLSNLYNSYIMDENCVSVIAITGDNELDKVEIIRIISETLSNTALNIDLSDYTERYSISKVIGPPPGYVGFEYGGQLTELIKNSSSRCIIMHNADKCHPAICSLLCNSIKKGYIKDSRGEVVSLSNIYIIFNVKYKTELNNFNSVVNEVIEINGKPSKCTVHKLIKEYCNRIRIKCNITVEVQDNAIDYILNGDSIKLLNNLKIFISNCALSAIKSNSRNILVGVSLNKFTIVN